MATIDINQQITNLFIADAIDRVRGQANLDTNKQFEEAIKIVLHSLKTHNFFKEDDTNEIEHIKSQIKEILGYEENVLVMEDGYHPWLEDIKTEIDWIHRDRYYYFLSNFKKWDNATIRGSIDVSTDIILDHLANPRADYNFERKGLVIGDVQSGKTANYIGLINKAFDVGYQLIIVLAGMQNDLRSQTQERLDKEVLGYETSLIDPILNGERIGVGKIPEYVADIESLTSRGNNGDYKKKNGIQLFTTSSSKKIAIVKKNTTVLKNLYEDLSSEINLQNGKFATPVLIIDDEVDQASVNTKKDPELDPTRINAHIRNIIKLCNKVSYIGYTATPFANIFINSNVSNETFGKDLFPKDFIVCLPKPKGYCGVDEFFGDKEKTNLELFNTIDDYEEFGDCLNDDGDFKPKSDVEIDNLAPSLKRAIKDFIIASAIRRSRIKGPVHNGMMINIAQYKSPTTTLRDLVDEYVSNLYNEFMYDRERSVDKYKEIFYKNFYPVSARHDKFDDWDDVKTELSKVFKLLKVKLLNGDSKDVIDYTISDQSQIIAIGGNKLSRGITIEGLLISYYLRDPKAYDTAFQMGRWFGYKKDYLDLCRIYTQEFIVNNFIHMMDATNELKNEIAEMNNENMTPKEFGLKVKTHPTMLPTAKNKMRSTTTLKINLSGKRIETTRFSKENNVSNISETNHLIKELTENKEVKLEIIDGTPVFRNCSSQTVINYLQSYHEPLEGYSKISNCKRYIKVMNGDNELINWTVVLSTLKHNENGVIKLGDFDINKATRTGIDETGGDIRVLARPEDFKYIFVDEKDRKKFNGVYNCKDPLVKEHFTVKQALLVIYCVNVMSGKDPLKVNGENMIGLGLWFPETSNSKAEMDYVVNDVYMEKQYEWS